MAVGTIQVELKRKPGAEDVPQPQYMSDHASGMDMRAAWKVCAERSDTRRHSGGFGHTGV